MHAEGAPVRPKAVWRPLVAVLVVVALLTGGWNLAATLLPDTAPVSAGSELEIGPEGEAAVTVTDAGWQVRRATTNPDQSYALTRGGVDLSIAYVQPPSEPSPEQLWSGFQRIVRVGGGELGEPSTMTTRAGQSGPLRQGERAGTAYAVLAPDGSFAIESSVLGEPHAATADLAAAERVVRSLTFQDGDS